MLYVTVFGPANSAKNKNFFSKFLLTGLFQRIIRWGKFGKAFNNRRFRRPILFRGRIIGVFSHHESMYIVFPAGGNHVNCIENVERG
jgi:hypothetical protein